jgi:NADPH2 dehydrogenase
MKKRGIDMNRLEKQIAFIKEAEGLKSVLREAWTSTGRRESTAEHSWRLALLAGLAAPSFPVDLGKTLMMCLVHDLGELYMGDISAVSAPDEKEKHLAEERDVRRALSLLPGEQSAELMALWQEYNENVTEEAKLVKALDKAETILQHNQGKNPPDFDYAFNLTYGKPYFSENPVLRELRGMLDAETGNHVQEKNVSINEKGGRIKMLNQSLKVRELTLRNRLVMPPMATAKSAADGAVTEELCGYYTEKSRGGYIGLVIVEHSYVSASGKASEGQVSISREEDVEGLRRLVSRIHQNGSPVFAQINHAGGVALDQPGIEKISASHIPMPNAKRPDSPLPKEMTAEDIKRVTGEFARAARRAKEAGFDGVEVHSAHGYLLNQFYSPLTNKRTDEYSAASVANRVRLHREILAAVRAQVGADYPIAVRLGGCDYRDGGSSIQDSVEAAKLLEEAGADLLDISGGFCGYIRPGAAEQGYFSEITDAIRKEVSVPVILTGGITDPAAAEALLETGKADLIGVGRAILRDSDWAKRAIEANR